MLGTHVVSTPVPSLLLPSPCGCCGRALGLALGVSRHVRASGVLHQEERDVHADGFFFLTPEHTWGLFCVFANVLYIFSPSSMLRSSRLHPTALRAAP